MADETLSTEIPADAETVAAGAGITADPPLGEAEQPLSIREQMEADLAKVQAEKPEEKPEEKPAKAVKAEADEVDTKEPAKAKPAAEKSDGVKPEAVQEAQTAKPSEGKALEPPARFLPKAREVWANTPNPVKAEVARMEREFATEAEAFKASKQFHEELREYDDLAKSHNTTVKAALKSYVDFENGMRSDPETTLPRLLQVSGLDPMRAVLAIFKGVGATPQQFAQHVLANPGQYQNMPMQQQRPVQPPQQDNVGIAAMREIQALRQELAEQRVASTVLDPFMNSPEHSRFEELQDDIAFFLNSDKVPSGLSDAERLAVAYDLAERINPAPYREAPETDDTPPTALVNPVAGKKSVKGAPNGGRAPALRTPSIREALAANWPG